MRLHTNSIATNAVRETTENGRTYLVAEDVTLGKPMELDGGWVPESAWRESADKWDGQPAPIGHPTDANGNVISAKLDAVQTHAVIGDIRGTYYSENDDGLNGDIWIDAEKAEQLGGLAADVPELLRNGNPLEVSTAYYSDPGEPGEYDGQYRENVRTNLRPDHLAILPGPLGPGRCDRSSGCGVPPSEGVTDTDGSVTMEDTSAGEAVAANGVMFANAAGDGRGLVVSELAANSSDVEESGTLSAGMQTNARSEARNPSYDGTESSSWGDVSKTFSNFYGGYPDSDSDVDSWSDASQDARSWIASKSMLGEADADTFDGGLIHPVVNPSTNDLNEGALDAILGSRGETDKASDEAIESSRSKSRSLLESKFDRDLDSNAEAAESETNMNTNQSEGDRVRWQSSNGNWRYGIVVDEAESSQQVADDEVLIAVYVNEEDGWTRSDETVTVEEDELNVIDEFPSEARSDNSADVPFDPSDLPEANSQSESFWQNMFSAAASFVSGSPEANSAAAPAESEPESEADGPSVAETDGGGSGCGCGGECSECSDEHDGTTHTHPGEAATSDEPDPDAANESENDSENESGGSDSESDTTTNTTSMSFDDSDYERLAENSGWSEDELRSNDDVAEKVAKTIDAQDDVNTNSNADEESAENEDERAEPSSESDASDDTPDADLESVVEDLQNQVEELKANQEQDRQERRDQQKEEILANSEHFTENMLEDMGDDSLEEAHERVVPQTNSPSGTDFGALNQPSAHINTDPAANSEDDDEDIGPATSGSFDDFMAANAEDD